MAGDKVWSFNEFVDDDGAIPREIYMAPLRRNPSLVPDKPGGLNGSMQHSLEAHPEGFQRLRIVREG